MKRCHEGAHVKLTLYIMRMAEEDEFIKYVTHARYVKLVDTNPLERVHGKALQMFDKTHCIPWGDSCQSRKHH